MKNSLIIAIICLLCGIFTATPGNAAKFCASKEEKNALDTRTLQSHFMVAALSCGQQQKYKNFVGKFKNELANSGKYLKSYFARNYKKNSEYQMNQFVTNLANESSKRSLEKTSAEYCAQMSDLFDEAEKENPKKISEIADRLGFSKLHKISPCK